MADPDMFLPAVALGSYLVAYVGFLYVLTQRRAQRKRKFFKALTEGLKLESLADLQDVVNIYEGVRKPSSEGTGRRLGLTRLLREFLVEVITREKSVTNHKLDENAIRAWKQKISGFIAEN